MPSKRKTVAESEAESVQDPHNDDDDDDDDCRARPKRHLAGKGGAASQLEKCADAITREDKRARLTVPSSEEVNKMAPHSPKRRRKRVKRVSELRVGVGERRRPTEASDAETPAVSSGQL